MSDEDSPKHEYKDIKADTYFLTEEYVAKHALWQYKLTQQELNASPFSIQREHQI